ncbi:MAG: hypothetical protein KDA80_07560 [Planctomycetaceae bacterium]|nr:hypothetical protein [Planctomycetaceae bacterium]
MKNARGFARRRCWMGGVILAGLFCTSPARAQTTKSADETLGLQSNVEGTIDHVIRDGEYHVNVSFPIDLMGRPKLSVKFLSHEPGEVRDVELRCGDFIKPDPNLAKPLFDDPGKFQIEKLKLNEVYDFTLKWKLSPNDSARQVEQDLAEFRKQAESDKSLPTDPQARQRAIDKKIRELILTRIISKRPLEAGKDRVASRMGASSRFDNPEDAEAALKDLYDWWEYDKLLEAIDETPLGEWTTNRRLKFGEEIMNVLTGRLAVDDSTLLSPQLRNKLVDGCLAELTFRVIPHRTANTADTGWQRAFRVKLDDRNEQTNGPQRANWNVSVGGENHFASDWLRVEGVTVVDRPPIRVRADGRSVATMWVIGPGGEHWLRVVPEDRKQTASVQIEVGQNAGKDGTVEIPERTTRAVTFPF